MKFPGTDRRVVAAAEAARAPYRSIRSPGLWRCDITGAVAMVSARAG